MKPGNGRSADPAGTSYMSMVDGIPKDATILTSNSEIQYADGTKANVANGVYNHHVFYADTMKTQQPFLACSSNKTGFAIPISIFLSSAPFYFTTLDGKFNAGYYIGKNDMITSVIDLGKIELPSRHALSNRPGL
jgi:hypothetical protein